MRSLSWLSGWLSFAFCLLDTEQPAVPIALKISPIETGWDDEGLSAGSEFAGTYSSFLS